MLKSLHIKNVALIKELEIRFGSGLNVLSGETGAGKSIIVDSLMLLLGARYDKSLLRYGEAQGRVEGVFDADQSIFSSIGLEEDDFLVVSRSFTADGKNEIRANGKIITTSMLKSLTSGLVDIYGQNEYQSLSRPSEHLRIVDFYVKNEAAPVLEELGKTYKDYRRVVTEMAELGELAEREKNIDFLRYQIDEIEAASVKESEEEEIAAKRKLIAGMEKLTSALGESLSSLLQADANAADLVDDAMREIGSISSYGKNYEELYSRLESVSIELNDIAETIEGELDNVNFDEKEVDRLEKRYDLLSSLKRKYGNYVKMNAYLASAKQILYKLENCAEIYEKLINEKAALSDKLYDLSLRLNGIRRNGAKKLTEEITSELEELGMKSQFEVRFEPLPPKEECENKYGASGLDNLEFFLSPNPGQPLKPLIKIISGGEMSRFMLALKVITSKADNIPTLIFDEIDTGISGVIGQTVAKKLAKISAGRQVLCVTHLAQIAAMADSHYYIEKNVEGGVTSTTVTQLDDSRMIEEVSRLSGGKDISSAAKENALEMKNWSNAYKKSLK